MRPLATWQQDSIENQFIPAQQGELYLAIEPVTKIDATRRKAEAAKTVPATVTVHGGDRSVLRSLGDIGLPLGIDGLFTTDVTADRRVLFSPSAGVIAWIVPTDDAINVFRFDPAAAAKKSKPD